MPAKRAGRRLLGLRLGLAGGFLALAGLVFLGFMLWRGGPSPIPARTVADDISAEEAEAVGYQLAQVGRHHASLPYYRRVVDQVGTHWMAHFNYSSALHNAAQESRVHLGRLEPAIRSSMERIELRATSLGEEDLAEFYAPSEHERALTVYLRGQTFQTRGFPLDALAEYRRAVGLSPGDSTMKRVATSLTDLLARGVERERR